MEYTITEAAKKLNISRQTIYNKLTSLNKVLEPFIKRTNGKLYLTDDALGILQADSNGNVYKYFEENYEWQLKNLKELNKILNENLEYLKEELRKKNAIIEKLLLLLKVGEEDG